MVLVHVTAKGTVADVTVKESSGSGALDAATLKCAMTWTYRPATQNGAQVESYTGVIIRWSLRGGTPPPPTPFVPPRAPNGWERDGASPYAAGILVSSKLSLAPAAEQYLSAGAYSDFSDLGDFVASNDTKLQGVKGLHFVREERTTLCNGVPASEIEYSQPGLLAVDPDRILDIEQVRTVKSGWAYVTTYIRPAESPERPDAEQWIHMSCGSRG
jgi:TonB family protein